MRQTGPRLVEGKVAVVSGAGPGLGRSNCTKLAHHGAKLLVADIDARAVGATVAALHSLGASAIGLVTDITDRHACDALVQHTFNTYGSLDILVNDANDGGDFALLEHADLARWRATSEVNVCGTLSLTQSALPALKATGAGVSS